MSKISTFRGVGSHDGLTNLSLAGTGVTYGHVDDQAQTFAGVKTFTLVPESSVEATTANQLLRFSQFDGHTHAPAAPLAHLHDAADIHIVDDTMIGRISGTGNPGEAEELTATQIRTFLNVQEGGGTQPTHTGDVTGDVELTISPNVITTSMIRDAQVRFEKIEDIGSQNLIGRKLVGSGPADMLTAAEVRTILEVEQYSNNYIHPSKTERSIDINIPPIQGAYISGLNFNLISDTKGHITGAACSTSQYTMTPAVIGAAPESGSPNYNPERGLSETFNFPGNDRIKSIQMVHGVVKAIVKEPIIVAITDITDFEAEVNALIDAGGSGAETTISSSLPGGGNAGDLWFQV